MAAQTQSIRILIADDHMMFCDALRSLLEQEPDVAVAGIANDGREVVKLVTKLKPDLLLLDLSMPGMTGLDVLQKLSDLGIGVWTMVLAASVNPSQYVELVRLGARGIVLKDQTTELLFKAIRAVMAGEYWIGRACVAELVDELRAGREHTEPQEDDDGLPLSPREVEIMASIADGCTNREIAKTFSLSEHTVKHHLTRIFAKTGVSNRLELAIFAMQHHKQPGRRTAPSERESSGSPGPEMAGSIAFGEKNRI
jgi:two-component system nitrate/nitrite response regulator NarL